MSSTGPIAGEAFPPYNICHLLLSQVPLVVRKLLPQLPEHLMVRDVGLGLLSSFSLDDCIRIGKIILQISLLQRYH